MHDPGSRSAEWRGCAVASRRRHRPVLRNVGVRCGDDAAGEAGSRRRERAGRHAGAKDQLLSCGRRDRPAVCRRAGPRSGVTDIEGTCRVEAAVFRGADVDERGRRAEYNCHGVCPGGRRLDALGVVDCLAKAAAACRRDGDQIGVAGGILHRGDVGRRIVPPDREDIGIPCRLRLGVGHGHLRLRGLRRGGGYLNEGRCCIGVRYASQRAKPQEDGAREPRPLENGGSTAGVNEN